jgi:hypothetical protein
MLRCCLRCVCAHLAPFSFSITSIDFSFLCSNTSWLPLPARTSVRACKPAIACSCRDAPAAVLTRIAPLPILLYAALSPLVKTAPPGSEIFHFRPCSTSSITQPYPVSYLTPYPHHSLSSLHTFPPRLMRPTLHLDHGRRSFKRSTRLLHLFRKLCSSRILPTH